MKNPLHSAKSVLIIISFTLAVFSLTASVPVFFAENGENKNLLALVLMICGSIIIVPSLKYIIRTNTLFKKSLIETLNNDKFLIEHLRYQRDEWEMFLKYTSIKESKRQRNISLGYLISGALFILILSQEEEIVFWGVGSVVFLMASSGALYSNLLRNKSKLSIVTLTEPEIKITSFGLLFGQSHAVSYQNLDGFVCKCSKEIYLGMNCICLEIKRQTKYGDMFQHFYILIPKKRENEADEIIDRLNLYLVERQVISTAKFIKITTEEKASTQQD